MQFGPTNNGRNSMLASLAEGAATPFVKYGSIVLVILIVMFFIKRWDDNRIEAQVNAAGNEATVVAYDERDTFVAAQLKALATANAQLEARQQFLEHQYTSINTILETDLDARLVDDPSYVPSANAANDRVYAKRNERVQEIYSR
jgi:hypothetical protein